MTLARETSVYPDDALTSRYCGSGGVSNIRIGIHTTIAGGLTEALESARKLGANCLQIFSASPRMWGGNPRVPAADAVLFRERRAAMGLSPLVIHANYLINLATPDAILRVRSVQAFHAELLRAIDLGADFLVLHPGSRLGGPLETAMESVADGLLRAARGLKLGGLQVLLENTAGQGTVLGAKFEELAAMRAAAAELPLGICLDTAHLLAAGFDIRNAQGLERTLFEVEQTIGLANVRVVHVNDSKSPLGSHVDRHEHIGKGHIGAEAFHRILTHPLLGGRAFVLETPIDHPGDDRRNVSSLWRLAGVEEADRPRQDSRFTMFRGKAGGKRKAAKGRSRKKPRAKGNPAARAKNKR